jgi:spore coat polysaccharide biosynthesis protein SpsF
MSEDGTAGGCALAVVQARMTSSRLPGKVLADVVGEPMLSLQLGRLARAKQLGRIVVATSVDESDDPVAELADALGAEVCRGSLDDVLARFALAAEGHRGPVVRLTADCPLIDPAVVDATVRLFLETSGCDYASNFDPRRYPDGLDTEVLSADTLACAAAEATFPIDREHVTPFVRRDRKRFKAVGLEGPLDCGELRWTVDTQDDLDFVRAVVQRLGSERRRAGWLDVLAAVRAEPSLAEGGRRG